MKSILFILTSTIFCFSCKAQDTAISLSKFEKMVTTPGRFYKIEEKTIGNIRSRNFNVMKITEVNGSESSSVLRISPRPGSDSLVPLISPLNLYFEKDDLTEVVKDLTFYLGEIKKNNASLNSYFMFLTPTDVRLTYRFYEGYTTGIYLEISKVRPFSKTVIEPSTITFRKKDIDELLDLLKLADSMM